MAKTIKYLLTYLFIISMMTIIGLEMDFDIIIYLPLYGIIGIGIFYGYKAYDFFGLRPRYIKVIIITSIFFTYILITTIIIYETNWAFDKVKSIPINNLIQFYKTKDIQTIPQEKRRAWIGVRYKEIGVITKNRTKSINAVGWQCNSVFAYYDLDEKKYFGSSH